MHLLIDHINPNSNGYIAVTNSPEKIAFNIGSIAPLQEKINEQWAQRKNATSAIIGYGRWIIVYQPGVAGSKETVMYFIDYHTDLEWLQSQEIFSRGIMEKILKLQADHENATNKTIEQIDLLFK
jgi:hypothetical protein